MQKSTLILFTLLAITLSFSAGVRHHIPDMETLTPLGFRQNEISATPGDTVYDERIIGSYTIRLWHPVQGLTDYATISAPGQDDIRVQDVESIGTLPALDVTGDGQPDIEFLTRFPGSHCCTGTVVYDLGAAPVKVLDIFSTGDHLTGGRGDLVDLNGDGVYEFVFQDSLSGIACSQPNVTAILAYDPVQKQYVGASPRFASYYTSSLPQLTAQAQSGAPCDVYPLITTLLYMGKTPEAQSAFASFYHAADAATFWAALNAAVEAGQFYVTGS